MFKSSQLGSHLVVPLHVLDGGVEELLGVLVLPRVHLHSGQSRV